jgi:predicted nucleotidyltransferase component of viral defense system
VKEMLEKKYVTMYARSNGIGLPIAERDIILTYVLRILSINKIPYLAFKGGTCLKKTYFGKTGRFSMDLDFTGIDISLNNLHDKLNDLIHKKKYYDILFEIVEYNISPESYFAVVKYSHEWNTGDKFELQVSFRERPVLSIQEHLLLEEIYFKYLDFKNFAVRCLQKEELLAEKIRATFQRIRGRDLFDLYLFAERPFNKDLIKALVVLKCYNARDPFDADRFFGKITSERYDWEDLQRLVRRGKCPPQDKIISKVIDSYAFLRDIEEEYQRIVKDSKAHREKNLVKSLISDIKKRDN